MMNPARPVRIRTAASGFWAARSGLLVCEKWGRKKAVSQLVQGLVWSRFKAGP